ncbi:MAG TPA: hypothetical protein VL171_18765 [Verrucomicrobiae bacterium]|nr:hypothetical protein [Verrucomicrobiae bacterium]
MKPTKTNYATVAHSMPAGDHAGRSPRRFAEFDARYIWASLLFALGGGFSLGAYLGWQIGFQGNLPDDLPVWIQVHGHLQLVGWVSLFVVGVSLFFLPRLAGTPIQRKAWHAGILPLIVVGLAGQSLARLLFSHASASERLGLRMVIAVAGVAEWLGLVGYITMLAPVALHRSRNKNAGLEKLRPFFLMMIGGWIAYATLSAVFALVMAVNSNMVAPRGWDRWAVDVELMLVLFPVAYAFSVRNLPYFLYLPPVAAPVVRWGWAYGAATLLALTGMDPWILAAAPKLALTLTAVGRAAMDVIMLRLVWDLNVFVRTRPLPYILAEKSPINPNPPPRPWRFWFDHASWGRPEWLIRGAYVWLAFGTLLDFAAAVGHLAGARVNFVSDLLRHVFLLGFITPLILGMAQKMVPGFLHKGRIAFPGMSLWVFLLINASVLGRTLPLLLPTFQSAALYGLAFSGPLALAALALFGWNLWATARLA